MSTGHRRTLGAISNANDSTSDGSEISDAASSAQELRATGSQQRPRGNFPGPSRPRKRRRNPAAEIGRPRPSNKSTRQTSWGNLPKTLPPWPAPAKLPYDVLLNIFQYASYPLLDEHFRMMPTATWLTKMALLRRDFAEPALSALYYSPPLESPSHAFRLLDALKVQNDLTTIDYRRKIRYLDIDASRVLCHKARGRDPVALGELVALTPMLRGIRINWPNDTPPYIGETPQVLTKKVELMYGEDLMQLFEAKNLHFLDWKWNMGLGRKLRFPWQQLERIHQGAAFQHLQSLEICRLAGKIVDRRGSDSTVANLTRALHNLTYLESLTISNPSSVIDDEMLELFVNVRPLASLSFRFCEDLTSDCLIRILEAKGAQLRHLSLCHNRSLDLSILGKLDALCPHLRSFTANLSMLTSLATAVAPTPLFETLIPEESTPSWPHTLQKLELLHLQKLDVPTAHRFLSSLLDAAPLLLDLRYLKIMATVDADWRERIKFRDVWEERILYNFLRKSAEPTRWSNRRSASAKPSSAGKMTTQDGYERPSDKETKPLHGMCDTVEIRIYNLRPMATQFDESNFLDDEEGGDSNYRSRSEYR